MVGRSIFPDAQKIHILGWIISMIKQQKKVCFGTLALGDNYRMLASLLAKDLEKYAPTIPLVVLTEKPNYFSEQTNVIPFKHSQQSLGCYHDKRFVLEKGLSLFESCIFIDADMRVLEPINLEQEWKPGITAHTVWKNFYKHNKNEDEIKLLKRMGHKVGLDLEDISFVHECFFVLNKDNGKEQIFLEYWEKMALFFELNNFCRGEGHTIGLAAAMAGIEIRQDVLRSLKVFKDKIELTNLKQMSVIPPEIQRCLDEQKRLEYPQRSFVQKIFKRLRKILIYSRCLMALKLKTISQYKFYYD